MENGLVPLHQIRMSVAEVRRIDLCLRWFGLPCPRTYLSHHFRPWDGTNLDTMKRFDCCVVLCGIVYRQHVPKVHVFAEPISDAKMVDAPGSFGFHRRSKLCVKALTSAWHLNAKGLTFCSCRTSSMKFRYVKKGSRERVGDMKGNK